MAPQACKMNCEPEALAGVLGCVSLSWPAPSPCPRAALARFIAAARLAQKNASVSTAASSGKGIVAAELRLLTSEHQKRRVGILISA